MATYKDAGVDIDAAHEANKLMKAAVASTYNKNVKSSLGSFGGLFALDTKGIDHPLLVSSTDGVGTKLKLAHRTGRHDTVGQDLVNHCVNDILVQGAKPLFFLDYIGVGRLEPDVVASVVEGFAQACKASGCALIGGETAEMPGIYKPGDYDLAGTIVGIVDEKDLLPRKSMTEGDILIGLPSNGLHTNGYSLAQQIVFDKMQLSPDDELPGTGKSVNEVLMVTHTNYYPLLKGFLKEGDLKGLAHITGGGLTDNIPRVLPEGLSAQIAKGSWPILPVFETLQKEGRIPEDDLYHTFNMGIGMVVIMTEKSPLIKRLGTAGKDYFIIGKLIKGERTVVYR